MFIDHLAQNEAFFWSSNATHTSILQKKSDRQKQIHNSLKTKEETKHALNTTEGHKLLQVMTNCSTVPDLQI